MTAGKYCVRYSTQAKKDLKAIFSYIAYSLEARQTANVRKMRKRTALRPAASLGQALNMAEINRSPLPIISAQYAA